MNPTSGGITVVPFSAPSLPSAWLPGGNSSTDTLSYNVPVSATGSQAHSLLHHDVLQLGPHLSNLEGDTM